MALGPGRRALAAAGGIYLGWLTFRLLGEAVSGEPAEGSPVPRLALGDGGGGSYALPDEIKTRLYNVKTIEQRVEILAKLIRKGGLDPKIRERALKILTRKCGGTWCVPEKKWGKELVALFADARQSVRYTKDPLRADGFQSALRTLGWAGGDCDDYTSLLGSELEAVGYPTKIRVVQTVGEPSWNHVYLLAGIKELGKAETRWVPLDASLNKPAGWEVPGADETAKTGKPAGMVLRVATFDV